MKKRFLVIRLSSLGDLVLISPVLSYLGEKGEVHLLTYRGLSDVYEGDERVSKTITLSRKPTPREVREVLDMLKAEGYEAVFDLQVKALTLFISHNLKGAKVVRTDKRALRRRLHVWFGWPLPYTYVARSHLTRVASFFGEIPPNIKPSLKPRPNPLKGLGDYVLLSPEASTHLKRWDFRRFSSLARGLKERGYEVVWVGVETRPEVEVGVDMRGRTNLKSLIGIVGGARAVVGNDSAVIHIAYALNVPTVVLMGPTTPSFGFVPRERNVEIVERNLKCRPCSTNGSGRCWVGGRPCLDIGVDEVLAHLFRLPHIHPT